MSGFTRPSSGSISSTTDTSSVTSGLVSPVPLPLHLADRNLGHALIISCVALRFFSAVRHDYPALNRWLKNLYWNNAAFKDTTDFETSKEHYYFSHKQINGSQVVPIGPKYPVEPL